MAAAGAPGPARHAGWALVPQAVGYGIFIPIGPAGGTMLPVNAAALVGAGVLSVLFCPSIATALHRRRARGGDGSDAGPDADAAV